MGTPPVSSDRERRPCLLGDVVEEIERLDARRSITYRFIMSDSDLLTLKQQLTKLSESERREVSAFIVRLGQESKE